MSQPVSTWHLHDLHLRWLQTSLALLPELWAPNITDNLQVPPPDPPPPSPPVSGTTATREEGNASPPFLLGLLVKPTFQFLHIGTFPETIPQSTIR